MLVVVLVVVKSVGKGSVTAVGLQVADVVVVELLAPVVLSVTIVQVEEEEEEEEVRVVVVVS